MKYTQTITAYPELTDNDVIRIKKLIHADEESQFSGKSDTWESVMAIICNCLNLKDSDVIGKKRDQKYCDARKIFVFVVRRRYTHSLSRIGCMVGYRNHATVIHNIKQVPWLVQYSPEFREKYNKCQTEINRLLGEKC